MKATIFDAMRAGIPPEAALEYHENGLNVLPLDGKRPKVHAWRRWQTIRQPREMLWDWVFTDQVMNDNIGIILGKVSGGLVVIDLDGLDAVAEFEERFPHLTDTLTVLTGSRKGKHLYYWCEDTSTVRMKGFEIRGDGTYVVAPPSVHPVTGWHYIAQGLSTPTRPARRELDEVRAWIRSHRAAAAPPAIAKHCVLRPSAWAEAALRGELATLAQTQKDFNTALYRAALKLGSIVADGKLSRDRVESALYGAATAAGYVQRDGERQTWATINSGLRNGLQHPRSRA